MTYLTTINGHRFHTNGSTYWAACRRCDGEGTIPTYRHVNGGTCALCGGTGYRREIGTRADAERTAKRRNADKRRREAKRRATAPAELPESIRLRDVALDILTGRIGCPPRVMEYADAYMRAVYADETPAPDLVDYIRDIGRQHGKI